MKGKNKRAGHPVYGWVPGIPADLPSKLPEHLQTLEGRQKFFMELKKKREEEAKKK